jgi:hypothetical protein
VGEGEGRKTMMLVLKIAGGVFLGILAAALVYEGFNIWEAKQRVRLYMEEQKQQADAAKERMKRADARLFKLSPNQALELCGSPLHETSNGATRTMTYMGADSHLVTLHFSCFEKGCLLWGA